MTVGIITSDSDVAHTVPSL